jgi:hypothetical protein
MKAVKKYQTGGSANAKKVAANKAKVEANRKKVEANRKKVEANREKVLLGKRSPNSESYQRKPGKDTFMGTDEKGNVNWKNQYNGNKNTWYSAPGYDKPRREESTFDNSGKRTLNKAQSMDTTGYAAGKKNFVLNTKVKSPGEGNMYKQSSTKVPRKDVIKTLAKMQKMRKGGSTKKK